MKNLAWLAALLSASLLLAGCSGDTGPRTGVPDDNKPKAGGPEADKIETNLAKLSPEDRKFAEAQGYCAVMTDHKLGEMGKPFKIEIKGEPVFLCCEACEKDAKKDPDKTLAKVKELKGKE